MIGSSGKDYTKTEGGGGGKAGAGGMGEKERRSLDAIQGIVKIGKTSKRSSICPSGLWVFAISLVQRLYGFIQVLPYCNVSRIDGNMHNL